MSEVTAAPWLPKIEGVEIRSATGHLWPDGWLSRDVRLTCVALTDLSGFELRGWNPDWCAVYAHNVTTFRIGAQEARTQELYMGETFRLRITAPLSRGQSFVIQIESQVARPGDALDARERGIILSKLGPLTDAPTV
jgi:hypothetical protein